MILVIGSNKLPTSKFSTSINLEPSILFVGQEPTKEIYHTSFADCPNLLEHLNKFEIIYWANSDPEEFNNFSEFLNTIYNLKIQKKVIGLPDDPYNIKQNLQIKNDKDKIVFLGCSHTTGGHLLDKTQEYTSLVSNYFKLESLNLAEGGKGNVRSVDIFNKINFFKNQIVVLQLSHFSRLRCFLNDSINERLSEFKLQESNKKSYVEVFNDKQLLYITLSQIDAIVRFSRNFGLRFVFFNLGGNPKKNDSIENVEYKQLVEYYLSDYIEYIPNLLFRVEDYGIDNLHYGVKTNKIFAEEIIKKIENLYL
jgi:hypothetical protein